MFWDKVDKVSNPPNNLIIVAGKQTNKQDESYKQQITLDRYLDILHILVKDKGTVQKLSQLETAAIKMTDLKQILALHGYNVPAKYTKTQVLERMVGMKLINPTITNPSTPSMLDTPPTEIEPFISLTSWLNTPALFNNIDTIKAAIQQDGFYTTVPIPDMTGPLPCLTIKAEEGGMDIDHPAMLAAVNAPEWLVEGIKTIEEESQASSLNPKSFIGRKIALVLLDDFQQEGANGYYVDTVEQGVHTGQVVEFIGTDHIDGVCELDCIIQHQYHYVRVFVSASTAPVKHLDSRRLDLIVDLRTDARVLHLSQLLVLKETDLMDAWALLEPND